MEPVGVKNNGDGTHTVHYTPAQDGPYTVAVKYADQEVPHRFSIRLMSLYIDKKEQPGCMFIYVLIKVSLACIKIKKRCASAIFLSLFFFLSQTLYILCPL